MHVDCKLTLEPISVGAIDTGQDEKDVEQPHHHDATKRLERVFERAVSKNAKANSGIPGKEQDARCGAADRSPRSEATFIRTGIEGCLRRSQIRKCD